MESQPKIYPGPRAEPRDCPKIPYLGYGLIKNIYLELMWRVEFSAAACAYPSATLTTVEYIMLANSLSPWLSPKRLAPSLVATSLTLSCLPAYADTHEKVAEFVKNQVQLREVDEGTRSRCITEVSDICLRRDTWRYWTIPRDINVSVGRAIEVEGETVATGTVTYNFDCRERRKRYDAGIETGTNDTNRPGAIVADFRVTFGELSIANVRRERSSGYCGNSIMARMVSY